MLGPIVLKLLGMLEPDDMKQLRTGGCAAEAFVVLELLHRVAMRWQRTERVDKKVWAGVQVRLNQLRAALREEPGV